MSQKQDVEDKRAADYGSVYKFRRRGEIMASVTSGRYSALLRTLRVHGRPLEDEESGFRWLHVELKFADAGCLTDKCLRLRVRPRAAEFKWPLVGNHEFVAVKLKESKLGGTATCRLVSISTIELLDVYD